MSAAKPQPGIYELLCTANGRRYIGSATWLPQRRARHFSELRAGTHANAHLQAAWNLYGEEAFAYSILESVTDSELLIEREQWWIDRYPFEQLFNLRPTARSNKGFKHTQRTRDRQSAAMKKRVFSAEHLANLSEAGKKRAKRGLEMHHPEAVKRQAGARVGKPRNYSPEDLKRRSDSMKLLRATQPHPRGMLGKKHSLEARSLMSEKHRAA